MGTGAAAEAASSENLRMTFTNNGVLVAFMPPRTSRHRAGSARIALRSATPEGRWNCGWFQIKAPAALGKTRRERVASTSGRQLDNRPLPPQYVQCVNRAVLAQVGLGLAAL